jgi:predicted nucleic acid-binding protein
VRGADAVYVALARELDDELVTADRDQATRGGQILRTLYLPDGEVQAVL